MPNDLEKLKVKVGKFISGKHEYCENRTNKLNIRHLGIEGKIFSRTSWVIS